MSKPEQIETPDQLRQQNVITGRSFSERNDASSIRRRDPAHGTAYRIAGPVVSLRKPEHATPHDSARRTKRKSGRHYYSHPRGTRRSVGSRASVTASIANTRALCRDAERIEALHRRQHRRSPAAPSRAIGSRRRQLATAAARDATTQREWICVASISVPPGQNGLIRTDQSALC